MRLSLLAVIFATALATIQPNGNERVINIVSVPPHDVEVSFRVGGLEMKTVKKVAVALQTAPLANNSTAPANATQSASPTSLNATQPALDGAKPPGHGNATHPSGATQQHGGITVPPAHTGSASNEAARSAPLGSDGAGVNHAHASKDGKPATGSKSPAKNQKEQSAAMALNLIGQALRYVHNSMNIAF